MSKSGAWDDWNRLEGAIEIPISCPALLLESVFSSRREVSECLDKIIWLQSDFEKAKFRGIERGGGNVKSVKHWDRFESYKSPFWSSRNPWERADVLVCDTPETPHGADEVLISSKTLLDSVSEPECTVRENFSRVYDARRFKHPDSKLFPEVSWR